MVQKEFQNQIDTNQDFTLVKHGNKSLSRTTIHFNKIK